MPRPKPDPLSSRRQKSDNPWPPLTPEQRAERISRPRATGKLRIGDKWGWLECLGYESAAIRYSAGGGAYITDLQYLLKILRCSGGGEGCRGEYFYAFDSDVPASAKIYGEWAGPEPLRFTSRKLMRHCGCLADRDLPQGKVEKENYPARMGLWMPLEILGAARQCAEDRRLKISVVYRTAIECALRVAAGDRVKGQRQIVAHISRRGESIRQQIMFHLTNKLKSEIAECGRLEGLPMSTCAIALIGLGLDQIQNQKGESEK